MGGVKVAAISWVWQQTFNSLLCFNMLPNILYILGATPGHEHMLSHVWMILNKIILYLVFKYHEWADFLQYFQYIINYYIYKYF